MAKSFRLSWHLDGKPGGASSGSIVIHASDALTVGRENGADVLLKDDSVSRLHAEIGVESGGARVRDRGSANGIRLNGRKIVSDTLWRPGQTLSVGRFELQLESMNEIGSAVFSPRTNIGSELTGLSRMNEVASSRGRVDLGGVFKRARDDNKGAVKEMFADFLGRNEQVVDCGYLGALGFVFPEHSFWCVTDKRVCSLMVNSSGWVQFNFGFIQALNRGVFVQPSLFLLWVWVIAWFLSMLLLATGLISYLYFYLSYSGFYLHAFLVAVAIALVLAGSVLLLPWVVRAFYRWVKSGCIFWTTEFVPIVVPCDRNSLRNAQRFVSVFTDQKLAISK